MSNVQYNNYRIEYIFNKSKFGFSNSVTVSAINNEDADKKAIVEVSSCYGSKMLKHFTFKPAVKLN